MAIISIIKPKFTIFSIDVLFKTSKKYLISDIQTQIRAIGGVISYKPKDHPQLVKYNKGKGLLYSLGNIKFISFGNVIDDIDSIILNIGTIHGINDIIMRKFTLTKLDL